MPDNLTVIRARAPLRLGLGGGGSDLSPFCDEFGGFVLNATIALFVYAMLQPRTDGKVCFVAADREETFTCDAGEEIPMDSHLRLHKAAYLRIIRDFNKGKPFPLTLTTYSDVPAGSGLGSSSALVVAMIEAFKELFNLPLGEYEVAQLAHSIERVDAGMQGGKQDQYAATFGGFNFMEFYGNNRIIVNPLRIKDSVASEFEASLVLFNTGVSRDSEAIIAEQTSRVERRDAGSLDAMHKLKAEAVSMKEALLTGNMRTFGEVLNIGWESKKRTAGAVTNAALEEIYRIAMSSGAFSGKVSGAGGGGYMMFLVDPVRKPEVWRALQSVKGNVMRVQFTSQGSVAWRSR
jgi:D-glycero-alpha-D-manno-heptose-7-phosphate kinase